MRPYGWDACFMSITHYKPTCREWSRPFWDFVLDDLKIFVNRFDHVLAPFLMGASPPQTYFFASSLPRRARVTAPYRRWKIDVSNLRAVQQIFYCLCMVQLHIIHYENRVSVISLFLKSQSTSAVLLKIAINYST